MNNKYTAKQVASALKFYPKIQNRLNETKIDIDIAIKYGGLTIDEMLAIKMIYAMDLSLVEAHTVFGEQLGTDMVKIKRNLDNAIDKITLQMNGEGTRYRANTEHKPFIVSKKERQLVTNRLAKHDSLLQEALNQQNSNKRKDEIMEQTSDNVYNYYDTSPNIENPNRKYDYINRLQSGKDYFMEQYVRNNIGIIEGMY